MSYIIKNMASKLTIAAILVMYFYISFSEARPSEDITQPSNVGAELPSVDTSLYNGDLSEHVVRQIQKCDNDLEAMELCMRCAKVTKSEIVYPMCCDNEEGVKEWCHDYIYFGATPSPP